MQLLTCALALVFSALAMAMAAAGLAVALSRRGGGAWGGAEESPPREDGPREQRRVQQGIANILSYGMEELQGRRDER